MIAVNIPATAQWSVNVGRIVGKVVSELIVVIITVRLFGNSQFGHAQSATRLVVYPAIALFAAFVIVWARKGKIKLLSPLLKVLVFGRSSEHIATPIHE